MSDQFKFCGLFERSDGSIISMYLEEESVGEETAKFFGFKFLRADPITDEDRKNLMSLKNLRIQVVKLGVRGKDRQAIIPDDPK